jgi:hypothetical protein
MPITKEQAQLSKDAAECSVSAAQTMLMMANFRKGKVNSKQLVDTFTKCSKAGHSYIKAHDKTGLFKDK